MSGFMPSDLPVDRLASDRYDAFQGPHSGPVADYTEWVKGDRIVSEYDPEWPALLARWKAEQPRVTPTVWFRLRLRRLLRRGAVRVLWPARKS